MTREELRDYVDEQRALDNIPYHVYSALIDGIDTLEQEPTTKNDLPHCQYSDEEIAKSFIKDAVYRVKQWFEHISTTKNDFAQERYQDLIEYFGDEKVAKTILESRKQFKAWLESRWIIDRAEELLAEKMEQMKEATKNDSAHNLVEIKYDSLTEFMDERYKNREDKDNMFGVGVSDAEFRAFIIDYLLGEDWYVTDPLGQTQINEIALYEILKKYSKRYRKECKGRK